MNIEDLWKHLGHKIELATYGNNKDNISLECMNCYEVLWDNEREETNV